MPWPVFLINNAVSGLQKFNQSAIKDTNVGLILK